jgi:hypothetical protein
MSRTTTKCRCAYSKCCCQCIDTMTCEPEYVYDESSNGYVVVERKEPMHGVPCMFYREEERDGV